MHVLPVLLRRNMEYTRTHGAYGLHAFTYWMHAEQTLFCSEINLSNYPIGYTGFTFSVSPVLGARFFHSQILNVPSNKVPNPIKYPMHVSNKSHTACSNGSTKQGRCTCITDWPDNEWETPSRI